MIKDPFYDQIVKALGRELDPNVFEACACDLLRKQYPGLVPIRGGNDAGMDGAIADGRGEAYPLVATTSQDVIGNLTGSLDSYTAGGGERRRVVVATSQALTPKRRQNLRDRAREKGFKLVQVHEQRDLAARLYRSSRWCRDLLDLDGKPSPLSVVPPRLHRPLEGLELRGRQADLDWLRSTSGDRVLVGGPGLGKTFLLHRLALDGWGLFLDLQEADAFANALRDQEPQVVIVDDAHLDLHQLTKLRSVRRRMEASFDIVATTWKGSRADVVSALNVGTTQTRVLEPLGRRDILDLYEEMGIRAEPGVMTELVDQAAGRPGLAATLGALCLQGDWLEVLRGESLRTTLLPALRRLTGDDGSEWLAAFAIGGRVGMGIETVAEWLELSNVDVRRRVNVSAAAGVMKEVGENRLAVEPPALRSTLLASVFFKPSATRLDHRPFLDQVPDLAAAVYEMANAAHRGAEVSRDELRDLLLRVDPTATLQKDARLAWRAFASLDEASARWALENYPGDLTDIAEPVLEPAAEAGIDALLHRAADDLAADAIEASNEKLAVFHDWFRKGDPVERRLTLLRRAAALEPSPHNQTVIFRVACLALEAQSFSMEPSPAEDEMIVSRTTLRSQRMDEVWDHARPLFERTGILDWPDLHYWSLLPWVHLDTNLLGRILGDLARLVQGRPELASALDALARQIDVDLELELDPVFGHLFFPPEIERPKPASFDEGSLIESWVRSDPGEVMATLRGHLQRARVIGRDTFWPSDFCEKLAAAITEPDLWVRSLVAEPAPSRFHWALLARLLPRVAAETWALTLIEHACEEYRRLGFRTVLRADSIPDWLFERALAADDLLLRCIGDQRFDRMSIAATSRLLECEEGDVSIAAAYAESAFLQGARPALAEAWRRAVLRAGIERPIETDLGIYHLGLILESDVTLTLQWLRRWNEANETADEPRISQLAEHLVASLALQTPDEHQALLAEAPEGSRLGRFPRVRIRRRGTRSG